jgi:hypothetical protein
VAEPIRVEAPSAGLAHTLMERLHAFPTQFEDREGSCEVRVLLVGNRDKAVVQVLNSVDDWLLDYGLASVRVHLDERIYTLTPPR